MIQPGTNIKNLSNYILKLEHNFWWLYNNASINSTISGPSEFLPFSENFIGSGPSEPMNIDSVRNYSSSNFSTICDSIGEDDTLYISVFGKDRNSDVVNASFVILRSRAYPSGIGVALTETYANSGIFEGEVFPIERTNSDSLYIDDIFQRIGVNSNLDLINIISYFDTMGRKIYNIKKFERAGIHQLNIDSQYLTPGIYFMHFNNCKNRVKRKIALIK